MNQYKGIDNYGRPKCDYLTKIAALDDKAFYDECYSMIYQAARCSNNLRADWHWMVDACYDEAKKLITAAIEIYREIGVPHDSQTFVTTLSSLATLQALNLRARSLSAATCAGSSARISSTKARAPTRFCVWSSMSASVALSARV